MVQTNKNSLLIKITQSITKGVCSMAKRNSVNDHQKANKIILEPRNERQATYIKLITHYDQIFVTGPAGSGKTYIPTVMATKAYLRGEIDKILITRPAVEVGEKHGFLPGDINRKLAPWVLPITEIIEELVGKQKFEDMLKNGDIEVSPFTYMRGRTFRNAFVILDEAQNVTRAQMEMFLTRMGDNCKLIVCGDIRQTDIGTDCGLSLALNLIKKYDIPTGIIEFNSEDVVRSELCKLWVQAFEREF